MSEPPPGYPGFGSPYRIDLASGPSWLTLDDESGAAVFCAGDAELLNDVRRDYETANRDGRELEQALAGAGAFGLE